MRFEHLVEINDTRLPMPVLTRGQLWRGLIQRAEDPVPFLLGLDGCRIEARRAEGDATVLDRRLDFGAFHVEDRVRLEPESRLVQEAPATDKWPASRLTITIEEPRPGALFVRFVYESLDATESTELDATTRALREEAYKSSDLDTVRRIRNLAEQGKLD